MSNKTKKKTRKNPEKATAKTEITPFKKEKEESVSLREISTDPRTWKIVGAFFVLFSILLLVSFISYLFTWEQDQSVAKLGFSALFDNSKPVANLLGRFGALVSHLFIFNGFGLAAFLICTFFFVVGVNLLFRQKVFSIGRNLKYVTVGLLVLSITLSFISSNIGNSGFPFGGAVGDMICTKLTGALGEFGTGAALLLLVVGYFIWQFNPSFNWYNKKQTIVADDVNEVKDEEIQTEIIPVVASQTINELYQQQENDTNKGNSLKGEGPVVINFPDDEPMHGFEVIEKEEPKQKEETVTPPIVNVTPPIVKSNEVELSIENENTKEEEEEVVTPTIEPTKKKTDTPIELEIKAPEFSEEEPSVVENLQPYEPTLDLRDYKYPTLSLLEAHGSEKIVQDANELENNKNQILATLKNYSIEIQKITATVGPTVTLYEIVPAPGVRISKIKNLEDDIALSLAALGIRIIAPIPGKGTIGIEVPNVRKSIVSMKALLASEKFQNNNYSLPIAVGKKIDNENFIVDLASMPHLLMAGATGQGKSVGVNAILVSLLYKKHPSQLKLVLIDPKKVELSLYRVIEKHFLAKLPGEDEAIITDTKKVINTLNALCIEMDNRYDLLKEAGTRNIKEYNEKFIKRKLNPQKGHQYLPFIVLVVDEFADLIMTAGKEIEMPIARLAQLARAVGIHLIIATQRPSVNIITGTIKANFPSRIAFKVSSKIDSRTILDTGGAEQLIGKGDMLISHNGEVTRLQCAFVDTPEVESVVEFIGDQRGYPQAFLLPEYVDEKEMDGKDFDLSDRDSLFEDAARLIVQNQIGSTSLLQRRMKLGYNRAGRLMDQLESTGIVGPNQGSKAREVLIKTELELQQHLDMLG